MPGKPIRYRMMDVGRPGHHYLEIAVSKKAGPRGGHTTGKLISASKMKVRARNMLSKSGKG